MPNSSSYSLNGVLESDRYRLLVDQEPELMGPGSGRGQRRPRKDEELAKERAEVFR